ncbi:MAG: NADH-quinone oxidoreductase subunit A [Halobacteriovoraceae bacterium]|nr:NADH-quinone oxidoreductase subunit A [Halobacteriovoraceae bacterium]
MPEQTLNVFMPVTIMMAIAVILFVGALAAARLLSPRGKKTDEKVMPYECGEEPVGTAWSLFNVRFYVVGLIFIIFDVESVLMFPVAAVFKKLNEAGNGVYVLIIFLSFISVLLEGIAYCWKKGDLDWVRSFIVNKNIDK